MTMPSDIDPQSGFRLPLLKREDLDEVGKRAYDRATTPGKTIVGLRGPSGIHLYSTKTVDAHNVDQPVSALPGLRREDPRGRDPHRRARDGQPIRMGRARAGSVERGRAAAGHRRHQTPQEHPGHRRNLRGDHRIRPADFSRPQGDAGGLCADEGIAALRTSSSNSSCSWATTPPPRRCYAPSTCRCRRESRAAGAVTRSSSARSAELRQE